MHFWINKGNQQGHYWQRGCRLVRPPPEAVANYLARHQIIRPRGLYPKPMVTPVRRFQSLESVSNNGLRYSRSSPCHRPSRSAHTNATHHIHYYHNPANATVPRTERQSVDGENELTCSQTMDNNELKIYIRKFKFALMTFALLSVCVFFGANYLTTGQLWRLGVETLVIISVALVVLLLGGIILLYLDERHSTNSAPVIDQHNLETCNDERRLEEMELRPEQRPNQLSIQPTDIQEIPPPPYHIAIRLSNQNDLEGIQIIDDQSPPPPYDKAINKCSLKKYQTNIL